MKSQNFQLWLWDDDLTVLVQTESALLCSECSKAQAVKEMFWMFQREHSKMFQMFRKWVYKLLKEYLVCWTLHIYFYKKRYIMIVLCVCERERYTHTHTHTQEGILLRETKKGSSTGRERERESGSAPHVKQILQSWTKMICWGNPKGGSWWGTVVVAI